VATFPEALDGDLEPSAVQLDDGREPVEVVPTAPERTLEVDGVVEAPASSAWPPIRPPVDGRERDEPFDWPFEARPSTERVEAVEGERAGDVHLVDPGLLR
jgi:hypothetical protein